MKKLLSKLLVLTFILINTGCAKSTNPEDPYEQFNRNTFALNQKIDKVIIRPAAVVYDSVTPTPIQLMINNFFKNLGEVTTIINSLLQGKFSQATLSTQRFIINSSVGFLGLMDVATLAGPEKPYEDFGTTLAHWGMKESAYLELPLLGPSTVRDTIAIPAGIYSNPLAYLKHVKVRNQLRGLRLVSARANFLNVENTTRQASVDPYVFRRNAYLQRRNALINGKLQDEDTFVDEYDDEEF